MIKVGIIGGAGYTAGELLRILINHPWVEIGFVYSRSQAGKPVVQIHADLIGETELVFTDQLNLNVDLLFLAMGHGESQKFLQQTDLTDSIKIIDLSQDFRLSSAQNNFVYGLPEAFKEQIKQASKIANPGCFATAIELALLPLAAAHLLKEDIYITAITGSTGAGQAPTPTTHFSWRNNNVSIYKPFKHQHLAEINQTLNHLGKAAHSNIHFVPVRGNFSRGILAAVQTKINEDLSTLTELYRNYFEPHPFVFVTDQNPDLKQVVNTNKALLHLVKQDDQLLVVGVIDNLIKGASGQAVQNMNLMFGFEESLGLRLKASAF